MASSLSLLINDESAFSGTDRTNQIQATDNRARFVNQLIDYLSKIAGGNASASLFCDISSDALAAATGTVTMESAQAADTVTLNGVVFTAVTGAATGANFSVDGSDTAAATSFVAAVERSSSALVYSMFSADNEAGVVTLTAKIRGRAGNAFTLASSNGTRLEVSGARLTGGAGGFTSSGPTTYNYGV